MDSRLLDIWLSDLQEPVRFDKPTQQLICRADRWRFSAMAFR
jgi:hypothetical protein